MVRKSNYSFYFGVSRTAVKSSGFWESGGMVDAKLDDESEVGIRCRCTSCVNIRYYIHLLRYVKIISLIPVKGGN